MKRLTVSMWLFALFCVIQTSCHSESSDTVRQNTLSRGINGDPEILDPHLYRSTQAGQILRDLGEGLLQYNAHGEIAGGGAKEWTISDSGLTYIFSLRNNARWSNGNNVVADDFVASFRRLVDPDTASPSAKNLEAVRNYSSIADGTLPVDQLGVFADDMLTLRIELETPVPFFLHLLTHPSLFPLCTTCEYTDVDKVSNGAYQLEEWLPSSAVALIRNPFYWNDSESFFDRVVYHVADPSVEVDRFRAGEIDITSNIDPSKFRLMREVSPEAIKVWPYLGVYYYGFNLHREPYKSNSKLRAALSLAIDRDAITEAVTGRGEVPAYGFVPPNIDSYSSQKIVADNWSDEARIRMAQEFYREAGYSTEQPLTVELRINTLGGHGNIALAVRSMWQEVLGIETKIVSEDFRVLLSNIQEKVVTEIFRLSWTGDYNDAHSFLQLFETGNPNNLTGYSNADVDQLMFIAARTTDKNERRELLEQVEKIVLSEHPVIPIYYFVSKHLVQPDIDGWVPNVLDLQLSKNLKRNKGE